MSVAIAKSRAFGAATSGACRAIESVRPCLPRGRRKAPAGHLAGGGFSRYRALPRDYCGQLIENPVGMEFSSSGATCWIRFHANW